MASPVFQSGIHRILQAGERSVQPWPAGGLPLLNVWIHGSVASQLLCALVRLICGAPVPAEELLEAAALNVVNNQVGPGGVAQPSDTAAAGDSGNATGGNGSGGNAPPADAAEGVVEKTFFADI